jgi:hypothetical protein
LKDAKKWLNVATNSQQYQPSLRRLGGSQTRLAAILATLAQAQTKKWAPVTKLSQASKSIQGIFYLASKSICLTEDGDRLYTSARLIKRSDRQRNPALRQAHLLLPVAIQPIEVGRIRFFRE